MNIRLIWVKPEVHILPKLNFFLSTKLKIRFRNIRTCVRFGIFNCVVELWEWRRSPTDRHHRYHTAVCRECHPVDPVHRSCLPWQERVGTASSRTSHWKSMYIGIFVVDEGLFKIFFPYRSKQLITDPGFDIVDCRWRDWQKPFSHMSMPNQNACPVMNQGILFVNHRFGDKKLVKWKVDIKCCMLEVVF